MKLYQDFNAAYERMKQLKYKTDDDLKTMEELYKRACPMPNGNFKDKKAAKQYIKEVDRLMERYEDFTHF
ncbi:hypothetical protein B566_EDAN002436 [Ephemera danica]|nr:hypothetical protein B566_EDAN002436 [Ephemera danica]